jgi:glycosyltransferase involved in cell wall biosynthesis
MDRIEKNQPICSAIIDNEQTQNAMRRYRPRVIIGHPRLGRGGSEERVMWLIEALKQDYDVTVLTTGGWDREELNSYYGTQVQEDEVEVRIAPVPLWARGFNAAALRGACFQRCARQIVREYDVRISAYNATDWGLPAIHFIADFSWHQEIRDGLHPRSPGLIYRDSIFRKVYLAISAAYAVPSGRDILHEDLVIANSCWTASRLKQYCSVDRAAVVYPSVWTEFPDVPWEEKKQSFVMIGRIAPEKRVERAIEILETVRRRGHAIRLHLCGQIENTPYGRHIGQLCRENAHWISAEGRVSGARKTRILAHCRFGIQTCASESFGIAVAEMAKAGAIVFASNDGGQTEILEHPDLLFLNIEDAVEKICKVLEQPALQLSLRAHLAGQTQRFSSQIFIREAQALVSRMTNHHRPEVDPVMMQAV